MNWRSATLDDVIELRRGFDLPSSERVPGAFPVVSAGKLNGTHHEAMVEGPGFAVGRATNLGKPQWSDVDFWPLNTTLYATDFKGNNPKWLYHLFETLDLAGYDSGSVQPMLNRNYIKHVPVLVPSRGMQDAISEVLGALDDKIAANRQVLSANAELSITLVERAIQSDSESATLEQVSIFMNRKRVPLSKIQRAARNGVIPYYGATGQMDSVDEAIFNENLVLVGEDGSVIEDDGTPIVQYIWGPSWVNNHAHVLRGNIVSTELLRWLIGRSNVTSLITGAVQPKLNMGNLKSLILEVPRRDCLFSLEQRIASFSAMERALTKENSVLARTRDELLPLLMNGRITVKDAEQVVEDVL